MRWYQLITVAMLLTLIAASSVTAQVRYPFEGIVVDNNVPVRAGLGRDYYIVQQLNKGDTVQVHDIIYGWCVITPPRGTSSFVAKSYVQLSGDGRTGTITGERVRVRAAAVDGVENSSRTHAVLNQGETVQIIGATGNFYEVFPPTGARSFVHVQYVRSPEFPLEVTVMSDGRLSPGAKGPVRMPRPSQEDDHSSVATSGNSRVFDPYRKDPQGAVSPGSTQEARQSGSAYLAQLESRFQTESQLPLEMQRLEAMLDSYRTLLDRYQLADAEQKLVGTRIHTIGTYLELRNEIEQRQPQPQRVVQGGPPMIPPARHQRPQDEYIGPDPNGRYEPQIPENRNYSAVGILLSSSIYNGGNLPLLYRLVEPNSGITTAYLHPNFSATDFQKLQGRMVGIVGQARFDSRFNVSVMVAQEIDVVRSGAG